MSSLPNCTSTMARGDGTIRCWADFSATSAFIALLGQYAAASFVTTADGFPIHDPPPAKAAQMLTELFYV